MDCVNHPGVERTAFCQNCGRALCAACVRREAGGQILCEPCWTTWQAVRAPFVPAAPGAPNPGIAAVLGLIPGVGAMYNGQFFKGLIHVVIFAVLISMAHYYGIFGIFIAAWVFYQSFEAYHTAKARRDGDPVPDPLGLNEVGNWLQMGFQTEFRHTAPPPPPPPGAAPGQPPAAGPAYQAPQPNPYRSGYQPPYPPPASPYWPYGGVPPAAGFMPGSPPPPASGFAPGPPMPPIPPVPPMHCGRKEPIAAFILIALGVLFLLGQFSGRVMAYAWPVVLIALGAWLIVRRMQGPPVPAAAVNGDEPQAAAAPDEDKDRDRRNDGGIL
jgi:TM2 domain-containing membrane protein YozV